MEFLRIKNLGEICEVIGRNHHGAVLLRNRTGHNLWFNQSGVEPCQHGQYIHCWHCSAPILLRDNPVAYHPHYVCSDDCLLGILEHYS